MGSLTSVGRDAVAKQQLCREKKTYNPFNIPNYAVRDFQRKRVYIAEECCSFWKEPISLAPQEVLNIVKAISEWADISKPRSFFEKSSGIDIPVPAHVAFATPDTIFLPTFALNKPFICHEMAHVISYQKGPNDHHGPNFVKIYLALVKSFMGEGEWDEIRLELTKTRVKVGT